MGVDTSVYPAVARIVQLTVAYVTSGSGTEVNCLVVYRMVTLPLLPCGRFRIILEWLLFCYEAAKRCIFGQLHLSRGWQPFVRARTRAQTQTGHSCRTFRCCATPSFSRSIGGVASHGCFAVCVLHVCVCLLCCHATRRRGGNAHPFLACN